MKVFAHSLTQAFFHLFIHSLISELCVTVLPSAGNCARGQPWPPSSSLGICLCHTTRVGMRVGRRPHSKCISVSPSVTRRNAKQQQNRRRGCWQYYCERHGPVGRATLRHSWVFPSKKLFKIIFYD